MINLYSFFCEENIICLLFLGREKKREFGKRKERKWKNLPSFLWSKVREWWWRGLGCCFVGLSRLEWWWVLGWDWVSFALHFLEGKRRKTNPLLFFLFFLVLLKRSLLFSPLLHKTTFLLSSSSLGEAFSPSLKTHLLLSLPHQSQLGFAWISIMILG